MLENRLNKFEVYTLFVWALYVCALFIRMAADLFRNKEDEWIYHVGLGLATVIVSVSLIWSLINALWIFNNKEVGPFRRYIWVVLSVVPFLYNIGTMVIELFD